MELRPGFSLKTVLPTDWSKGIFTPARQSWIQPIFALLVCLAFSISPLLNTQLTPPKNKDYDLWFAVGQSVVRGDALYPEAGSIHQYKYMYPPTMAIFIFAPLSMLGYTAFVVSLVVGNCLVWCALIKVGFRLYAGSSQQQAFLVFLLPCLALAAFSYDIFLLGQSNLLLLLLLMGMFAALRSQKHWLAGGALALAAAMKAFPISALAYLIYRRHWQAAVATLAGLFLILIILPAPIRGYERNFQELSAWYHGMLADQSGNSIGQRTDSGFTYKNQSLFAVVHRLTRHVIAGKNGKDDFYINILDLTPRESQLAAYGAVLSLGLIYLLCMPSRLRQTELTRRCEEAMLLLMMIFCSPLAWSYFYCWTFPAWVVLTHEFMRPERDAKQRRYGWIAFWIIALVMMSAITHDWNHTALALAATLWGGIGLFLMLGLLMRLPIERKAASPAEMAA